MSGEIKTFLLGRQCRDCETYGVHCSQAGAFTFCVPAEIGQVVIYLNGNAVLRTTEPINECPAITKQNTTQEVVAMIKRNAEIASRFF